MYKKFTLFLGALALAVLAVPVTTFANKDEVAVCHNTGSASNPVILIHVASAAVDAHLNHGDTLLLPDHASCTDDGGPTPE
jgi:uncharacterized integral membrane protein